MEHTYLLRPGRWRAEGTYYDDAGQAFPLTGRSELIQDGPERRLEGWMEVAGPQPLRFANHYTIRETDRPCTLAWRSENPALGVLEGTFELAGESILSRYVSPDRVYSGCEVLTLQGGGRYYNAGVSMKHGRRMSAWTAILREERGPD